jgi:hypothetical protein
MLDFSVLFTPPNLKSSYRMKMNFMLKGVETVHAEPYPRVQEAHIGIG